MQLNRRTWLQASAAFGISASGWLPAFAEQAVKAPGRKRSCILLWMNGGPSTIDLFDLKPGTPNGGPFKEIQTSAPGLKIGETLPKLAKYGKHMAVIRSMSTKEGDHARGTFLMRTGNLPGGAIEYPTIGSLVSKELGDAKAELPNFVSVSPFRVFSNGAFGPGFLGPKFAPLIVGEENNFGAPGLNNTETRLRVPDLLRPLTVEAEQSHQRLDLRRELDDSFLNARPDLVGKGHVTAYERAARLMDSVDSRAFEVNEEPDRIRDAYGRNMFGQGCLLARRLVERGVPFVEVNLGGWDTHGSNFDSVKNLSATLDAGWSALMNDLEVRGLLETTTIIWMGEFGRTPRINGAQGRDHFPNAWATVLAGGGVKGGQAYGETTSDGTRVEGTPTTTIDLLATLCKALGIDHMKQNDSPIGRPIRIVDKNAKPIKEVIA